MTPEIQRIVNEHPDMAEAYADGWQCYDVAAIMPLAETMAQEQHGAGYPLFGGAGLPADRTIFDFGDGTTLAAWREDGAIAMDTGARIGVDHIARRMNDRWAQMAATAEVPHDPDAPPACGRVQPGATAGGIEYAMGLLISCVLDLIATPQIVAASEARPPRAFRKRAQREGRPEPIYRRVEILRREGASGSASGEGAGRRLHFTSGHWRRSNSFRARLVNGELRVWVEGHWRGDPRLGIVVKRYEAGREAASRLGAVLAVEG